MRLLKSFRATQVAEDPAAVERLNGIASRSRAEVSLYQAVEKARKSQSPKDTFRNARNSPPQ